MDKYTVSALKQIAKEKGFKGYSKLKKAELVKLLAKHDELKLKNKKQKKNLITYWHI